MKQNISYNGKIDNTAKASKEWRERWAMFWRKYYSLSDRKYVDKRGRNKDKEELLSPRERYWNAFKETMSERFESNREEWLSKGKNGS